jgi:ribosome biogenesis GTPase / thiamine phosphate phosphatase
VYRPFTHYYRISGKMSKKKVRVELRKNRTKPPRANDLTQQFQTDAHATGDVVSGERVRAKGDISRHRTVILDEATGVNLLAGRVLRVHGLYSYVEVDDGRVLRCTVRRVLKSLTTDERSIVTTGDRVLILPEVAIEHQTADVAEVELTKDTIEIRDHPGEMTDLTKPESRNSNCEGVIERVEPRHGVLTRASRRREHVLVANVDQLVIVMSLVQPELKQHLIDRYVATAQKGGLTPVLCLNKADLADPAEFQPLIGAYSQIGISTMLTSATTGRGIDQLRELLVGRATVFSGQSGVGKSSLLNAIQPDLALRVKSVSEETQKGRHTTTTAELIRLDFGGWVVDTPGVRQLQLWDTRPEEVEGYFREFRPLVPLCGFPDCTHTHEQRCAVKDAVTRRHVSERRYYSYLGMYNGVDEE